MDWPEIKSNAIIFIWASKPFYLKRLASAVIDAILR